MKPVSQKTDRQLRRTWDEIERATAGDDLKHDSLGAIRGAFMGAKIVGGVFLLALWLVKGAALVVDGRWEALFMGTVFLWSGMFCFRLFEKGYPKDKTVSFLMAVLLVTGGLVFLS